MPTIYIVNQGGHDFSSAEDWGSPITFLSKGSISPFQTNNMYREFAEILNESKSDDYIVPCGLPTMSLIACAIFSLKHGRLNLLLFRNGKYIERRIDIGSLIDVMHDLTNKNREEE